jgi:hypothetical protein
MPQEILVGGKFGNVINFIHVIYDWLGILLRRPAKNSIQKGEKNTAVHA